MNAVRLCFQVFLKCGDTKHALDPIFSEPIQDKKSKADLIITRTSDCSGPVTGNKLIIILCEKVVKDDIQVQFYEEQDGKIIWQDKGIFEAPDVHRQVAIPFKIPPYYRRDIDSPVRCYMQLLRPSDMATSEPIQFDYQPLSQRMFQMKWKITIFFLILYFFFFLQHG